MSGPYRTNDSEKFEKETQTPWVEEAFETKAVENSHVSLNITRVTLSKEWLRKGKYSSDPQKDCDTKYEYRIVIK